MTTDHPDVSRRCFCGLCSNCFECSSCLMECLDLDKDAFYICTEMSPRCFVVQKAIQIDRSQIERMVGNLEKSQQNDLPEAPPAPIIPSWFTTECRKNLMKVSAAPNSDLSSPMAPSPTPHGSALDLKQQLKAQLEYYFSRENLMTDRYLRCQMDSDQYVPISIISGFRKIVQLTSDYNLILQVLRESNQVEVDERGEKVRPVCRRCTIILREISEEHKEDVEKMLDGGPPYIDLKYGLNNSWYVMYDNEETTQKAYLHLQSSDATFNNRPVCARIKAGGPPTELPPIDRIATLAPDPLESTLTSSSSTPFTAPLLDIGTLLHNYGYVAVATYTPGSTCIHVHEGDMMDESQRNNRGRLSLNGSLHSNGYFPTPTPSFSIGGPYSSAAQMLEPREARRRETVSGGYCNGRGGGVRGGGARRMDRNHHHGGRRNGGANGSNQEYRKRSSDYWQTSNIPILSVSTGDLTQANNSSVERPRYNSFRKPLATVSPLDEPAATTDLLSAQKTARWDGESENGSDNINDRKASSQSGCSVYSFEERAFPSLSEPKVEPAKPAEKPSFSCVAAGKRYAKPEPKKSYAEKLKEKAEKSS